MEKIKNNKPLKTVPFIIGGILLFIFGIASIGTGADRVFKELNNEKIVSDILMYIILGTAFTAGGILLFVKGITNGMTNKKRAILKVIIELANNKDGKITALDLSGATGMALEETMKILNEYSVKGVFETQVTEQGVVVYDVGKTPTTEEVKQII
jgi:hypothetical protein